GAATSTSTDFVIFPPPTPSITSLSPSTASAGQTVTINGSNFGATQGSSTISDGAITPTTWSSTSIQFTVTPSMTTTNVYVRVNGVYSNVKVLTVLRPTITDLSPSTTTVGSTVTVNGSNFGSTQGTSTLTLDGVA